MRLNRKALIWSLVTGVSGLLAFLGNYLPDSLILISVAGLIVFIPSFFIAAFYLKRADLTDRRMAAVSASMPEGVPVLYLRSFEDDKTASSFRGSLTEEEQLVRALAHIGPVIAIGKPGEAMPLAGAHRLYVSNDAWQGEVEALMRRARLIVIRSGLTPGLAWELDTVLHLEEPEKVMLLADSRQEVQHLLAQVRQAYPKAQTAIALPWFRLGSILGFIVFNSGWQAELLPLRRWRAYLGAKIENGSLMYAAIVYSLRPLYARSGVLFPQPPLDYKKIGTVIIFVGWLVFAAIVAFL